MRVRLVFAMSLLALAACGTSPPTRFFTLEPVPPASSPAAVEGAPITVDAVHLPGVLDRLEVVRQAGPNRLDVSERDRWGAPLDQMSRRVLAEDLAARAPAGLIVQPGAAKPAGPSRALTVSVQEFDVDAAGRAVLDADWTLLAGNPPKPALHRRERIEADGAAGGSDAQAAAMSRALGQFADRIVAALAKEGGAASGGAR